MKARLLTGACAAALALAASAVAAQPPADEVQPWWLDFREITYYVDFPGGPTDPPRPATGGEATIYLVGWMPGRSPQDSGMVFPAERPPGVPPQVPWPPPPVPQHDTVFPRAIPETAPAACIGVTVVPGPRANSRNVLTVRDPNGYPKPLVSAIRLGGHWVPLRSERVILLAHALGLVSFDPWPGYGGTCWTGGPWNGGRDDDDDSDDD